MHKVEAFGEPGFFFEGPRWHDGRWWASDLRGGVVRSYDDAGKGRDEVRVEDDRPSGLGWLPDGSLLIVAMERRRLLRVSPGATTPELYADLAPLCGEVEGFLNDMWVDPQGRAYVGFDADFARYGAGSTDGFVICVWPDGKAEIVARGLMFPNGIVTDGRRLVVAETLGNRFSAFPIAPDGSLGAFEIWGDVSAKTDRRQDRSTPFGAEPFGLDGCDIDAEGCIWAADYRSGCFRFAPGGDVLDSVFLPGDYKAWACALGGEDGRSLLICGADLDFARRMEAPRAQLFVALLDATEDAAR